MITSCLGALCPSIRWVSRLSRNVPPKPERLTLPYELWSEIFRMLDNPELVAVSRVSRAFNAHAVPIYLARQGMSSADLHSGTFIVPVQQQPDIFPALQTAVFLPPVRKLSCTVYGSKRFQIISYLASFLAQQTTLEDVHLTFYPPDTFTGFGPKQKEIPRRTVQRGVCRLLNCVTPTGKTLFITPDRVVISGSARGDLWSLVRPIVAPPRHRIRAKIIKVALAAKERRWATTDLQVVLNTVGELCGTTYRDSLVLDVLRSLHVNYSTSPGEWAVVVLNAFSVGSLNLMLALSAADWSHVLPQLNLPQLQELTMRRATVYSARPELHDIGITELDAFLIRHKNIVRLEYLPQLFPEPRPVSGLSLASLRYITHLTTTPAHFIHLHHAPNSFPTLIDLILFGPASIPVARGATEFMTVLGLLANTSEVQAPGLRLRFPGTWIAPPAQDLAIQCVRSLQVVFGDDVARDVDALAQFLAPFEAGLKFVEFQPTSRRTFEDMLLVDELRRRVLWLEDVSCARAASETRTVPHPKTRKTVSVTYSD